MARWRRPGPGSPVNIHHLITHYGYFAVFFLVAAESLGVPLPGETALIVAATYAGATGKLSPYIIFVVGATAAIIGDTCGYWIGDKGGYRLLLRYGRYIRFDEARIKVAKYLFARHGGKVVFFGRFVSVLRTYAAFLAGTSRMPYRRFIVFNASGGILWAALYTFAAYFAGSALNKISGPVGLALAGVAVVIIVIGAVTIHRRLGALEEKAEAAFPGPLDPP